jgi:hypothetical protein
MSFVVVGCQRIWQYRKDSEGWKESVFCAVFWKRQGEEETAHIESWIVAQGHELASEMPRGVPALRNHLYIVHST